jgi:hypothetical protein
MYFILILLLFQRYILSIFRFQTNIPSTSWMVGLFFFKFLGVGWDWVHLVRQPPFGLLYQSRMIDDDDNECGAVGEMRIGRWNRSTLRKPTPVPLYPPQIPHSLTLVRTRAVVVGSRGLTAWAMVRPSSVVTEVCLEISLVTFCPRCSIHLLCVDLPAFWPLRTQKMYLDLLHNQNKSPYPK